MTLHRPALHRLIRILAIAALLWSATTFAGERGFFGYGLKVSGSGFALNPTIKRITIDGLVPDSPAARGGVGVGDEVVKVQGVTVVGTKAMKLRTLGQREVGQTLHLQLKRPNGEVYTVALVAVRRPAGI